VAIIIPDPRSTVPMIGADVVQTSWRPALGAAAHEVSNPFAGDDQRQRYVLVSGLPSERVRITGCSMLLWQHYTARHKAFL
jgi:hypothetical protein